MTQDYLPRSGERTQLVKFMSCNRDDPSYIFKTQVNTPGVTVCICHSSSVEVGTCGSQGSRTNDSNLTGELQFSEKPCLIEGGLPGHDSKDYYLTFRQVHPWADTHECAHRHMKVVLFISIAFLAFPTSTIFRDALGERWLYFYRSPN